MGDLPRSVWNGTLQLRELVVPVGLAPTRRNGDATFKTIHGAGCGALIESARSCPRHGAVPDDELIKGWETAPGEYLPVDLADLEALAPPDTRAIEVYAIVDADAIDPLLIKRAYFLVPGKTGVGREGYAALGQALQAESLAGVARFTAWNAEHLAAIRPYRYVLVLQELAPHADLRDESAIADLAAAVELDDRTVELARKLVTRLEVPFTAELLTSLHRERVQQLLNGNLTTDLLIRAASSDRPAASGNIAGALEQSLRGIPRSRRGRLDQALART